MQGVHGLCSRWTEETQSSSGHLKTGVSHFVGKVSKEGGFCTKILIAAGIGTPRLCTLGVGVWRSSDDDETIGTSMTSCHPIVEELAASAKNHEVSLTAFVTSVLRGLRRTQEEVTGSVDVQSTFNTLLQGAHHGVRISLKLHQLPGLGWWWDPTSRSSDSPPFPPSRATPPSNLFLPQDTQCASCGQVLDRFCDHAAVCPCVGARTSRQHAVVHIF